MANAGLFSTPEQVIAAQQQAQAAQDPNTALRAALMGAGRAASGAFGRGLGAAPPPESEAVRLARTRTEAMQGVDFKDREGLFAASQKLVEAGDYAGGMKIAQIGHGIKEEAAVSPKKQGEWYQKVKMIDGKRTQTGTVHVPYGDEIPAAGEGEEMFKIGTGVGAGDTTISVNTAQNAFKRTLGAAEGERYGAQLKGAKQSVKSLRTTYNSRKLISEGVITGKFANVRLGLAKTFNLVGLTEDETVANTEALLANQGQEVLNIVGSGAVGAGTGISDKDIQFIKEVVAGEASLDEEGILRIMKINEAAHRYGIARHNREARKLDKAGATGLNYATTVEIPELFEAKDIEMKDQLINEQGQRAYKVNGRWVDSLGFGL